MDLTEYNKIKNYSYSQYCAYLQNKYGIPKKPYFTHSWTKTQGDSRTKEGLRLHHVNKDTAIMLSNPKFAQANPYEFRLPGNLVYCDYLEHLLLHIMICEEPNPNANPLEIVGLGGVINFLVSQLNDYYSGFMPKNWARPCVEKIIKDCQVYLLLVARFKKQEGDMEELYRSFNAQYGSWSEDKDLKVFDDLRRISGETLDGLPTNRCID